MVLTEENKKKIREIFVMLKKSHDVYVKSSNDDQIKILKLCEPFLIELESFDIPRHFSEALVVFGRDFLEKEYPHLKKKIDRLIQPTISTEFLIEKIFGVRAQTSTFGNRYAQEEAKKLNLVCYLLKRVWYDKEEKRMRCEFNYFDEKGKEQTHMS